VAQKMKNIKRWVDRRITTWTSKDLEVSGEVADALKFFTKRYLETLVAVASFEAASRGADVKVGYEDVCSARGKLGFSMRTVNKMYKEVKISDGQKAKKETRKVAKRSRVKEEIGEVDEEIVKKKKKKAKKDRKLAVEETENVVKVDQEVQSEQKKEVEKKVELEVEAEKKEVFTCLTCNVRPNQEDQSMMMFDCGFCPTCGGFGVPYIPKSPEYIPSTPTIPAEEDVDIGEFEDATREATFQQMDVDMGLPPKLRRTDSISDYTLPIVW